MEDNLGEGIGILVSLLDILTLLRVCRCYIIREIKLIALFLLRGFYILSSIGILLRKEILDWRHCLDHNTKYERNNGKSIVIVEVQSPLL